MLVAMIGDGKGTAAVDGGVIMILILLPINAVVSLLTRVPERVLLSPTLIDSGVNEAETIAACFAVGCCSLNVAVAVTLSLARAVIVYGIPAIQAAEAVFNVQEFVPEAVIHTGFRPKLPLFCR